MLNVIAVAVIIFVGYQCWMLHHPREGTGRNAQSPPQTQNRSPRIRIPEIVHRIEPVYKICFHVDEDESAIESLMEPDSETGIEGEVEQENEAMLVEHVELIKHVIEPYWQEAGWKPNGNRLTGHYRTQPGSYEGYIVGWQSPEPQFYVVKPPSQLQYHEHSACFLPRRDRHFLVHFARRSSSVDAGIVEIETVLSQALAGTHKRR